MDFQKTLHLKTTEEASIHFDIFSGTNGYADVVKDVVIGKAFNLYFLVEECSTLPLHLTIQKQVAFDLNGEKVYRDFTDMELVVIDYADKVYGIDISPRPMFDRLVISCSGGVGGETVSVLLKIL